MEALCGLFDTVAGIGEILSRDDEKVQELSTLTDTVEIISQSVKKFVSGMPQQDREAVYYENKVFERLVEQLRKCQEVIARQRSRAASEARLEDRVQRSTSTLGKIANGIRTSTSGRTFAKHVNEGLEVLGSKLGSLGAQLLRLPEDELELMKQASNELTRLVPLLNLAISTHNSSCAERGLKRPAEPGCLLTMEPRTQAPRMLGAPGRLQSTAAPLPLQDVPLIQLRLISDSPAARNLTLPVITTKELRPAAAMSISTSSLDSNDDHLTVRLLFGRQELSKVPRGLSLPHPQANGAPQPYSRFISRDLFLLEVHTSSSDGVEDSLNQATLSFGGCDQTLAWGGGVPGIGGSASNEPLAIAKSVAHCGLHHRVAGETLWRWIGKSDKVELRENDCLALLLESPPGSCTPGPPRDLQDHQVTCLLGLKIEPPEE